MNKSAFSVVIIGILICINLPGNAMGAAIENNAIGIKATAMACSFTGVADDASAVHHNPGGLAFNETGTWYGEAYVLSGVSKTKYVEDSMTDKSSTNFHIPGFFLARTFEKWAIGVGYYVSFAGGGVEYDNFQNSGYDLESYMGLSPLTTAAAYKISPELSLGASISLYTGNMGSTSLQEIAPGNYTEVETEYSGLAGYGYSVGMMYKPSAEFSLGLFVRSEIDAEMDGDSKVNGIKYDSEVAFNIPYMFSVGFGYKPLPDLTLSLSYTYIPWEKLDTIDVTTVGFTQSAATNYKDGLILGLGVEYLLNNEFTLWGGLVYGACGTKGEGISPIAPDSNKIQPSLGIGWNITQSVELAVSAIVTFGFEEEEFDTRSLDHDVYMLMSGVRFKF